MFDFSQMIPVSDLNKRIAKIGKVAVSLQAEIHEIAVQCLGHVAAHGDTTLLVRLEQALPSGQRRQAIAAWARHFSDNQLSLSYDKNTDTWKASLVKGWDGSKFRMDEAAETSFGDFLPEKGYATFDMQAFVNFLKRKANEDNLNPNGTPKVDPQVRELCASLFARLQRPKQNVEVLPLAALLSDNV